jgi:alpha-ketoglutarate-dependent taurine dioxygenase
MVWVNPLGQKALQVHGIAVQKMFLKATPSSEVKVVDDLIEIRKLLHSWQERIIRPEYVLCAPVEEGDVQMWDNWSIFHTAVDYPDQYGPRSELFSASMNLNLLTRHSYASSKSGGF